MGTIICEDLSHEIWAIPNDAAVDIPAMTERTCCRWVVHVVDGSRVSSTGSGACVVDGGICR